MGHEQPVDDYRWLWTARPRRLNLGDLMFGVVLAALGCLALSLVLRSELGDRGGAHFGLVALLLFAMQAAQWRLGEHPLRDPHSTSSVLLGVASYVLAMLMFVCLLALAALFPDGRRPRGHHAGRHGHLLQHVGLIARGARDAPRRQKGRKNSRFPRNSPRAGPAPSRALELGIRRWESLYVPIERALSAPHEPHKPQIFPEKSEIRGNSTFYVLRDLIDLLMIPRKIGRLPDQRGFITVRGYSNMALKKTAGATAGTAKKTAAKGHREEGGTQEGRGRDRDQEGGTQEGRRAQALRAAAASCSRRSRATPTPPATTPRRSRRTSPSRPCSSTSWSRGARSIPRASTTTTRSPRRARSTWRRARPRLASAPKSS